MDASLLTSMVAEQEFLVEWVAAASMDVGCWNLVVLE